MDALKTNHKGIDDEILSKTLKDATSSGLQQVTIDNLIRSVVDMSKRLDESKDKKGEKADPKATQDILNAWQKSIDDTLKIISNLNSDSGSYNRYFIKARDALIAEGNRELKEHILGANKVTVRGGYNYGNEWRFETEWFTDGKGYHTVAYIDPAAPDAMVDHSKLPGVMTSAVIFLKSKDDRRGEAPRDDDAPSADAPPPPPKRGGLRDFFSRAKESKADEKPKVGEKYQLESWDEDGPTFSKAEFDRLKEDVDAGLLERGIKDEDEEAGKIEVNLVFRYAIDAARISTVFNRAADRESSDDIRLSNLYKKLTVPDTTDYKDRGTFSAIDPEGIYKVVREADARFPKMGTRDNGAIDMSKENVSCMLYLYFYLLRPNTLWNIESSPRQFPHREGKIYIALNGPPP